MNRENAPSSQIRNVEGSPKRENGLRLAKPTAEPKREEWGYCPECKQMVEVFWEGGYGGDDIPEEYWEEPDAICPECQSLLPNCNDCDGFCIFEEDKEGKPWVDARGICPLGIVLAGNRACSLFKKRDGGDER